MAQIGKIGSYLVFWYQDTGRVEVGQELAGYADNQTEAMQVAKRWVEKFPNRS